MDTKLKKYDSSLFLKVIAVLLSLFCIAGCAHQAITSLIAFDESNLYDHTFHDAVLYGRKELSTEELTRTRTFSAHVSNYADGVAHIIGYYGDGGEKAYDEYKKIIEKNNDAAYKRMRTNLINHVVHDYFELYIQLVRDGVVVPLGIIGKSEYSGDIYELDNDYIDSANYHEVTQSGVSPYVKATLPEEVQQKADELGADGVFEIINYYNIVENDNYDYEMDEWNKTVLETYQPGFYVFGVNDEAFLDRLVKYDILQRDEYGSADEFAKAYKMYATDLEERYSTGRYFVSDGSGKFYTNVPGLDEKSTDKEIETAFSKLGFYCLGSNGYGELQLPDGKFYANGGFDRYVSTFYDYEDYSAATTYYLTETTSLAFETTTLPVPTSVTSVQAESEDVTKFEDMTTDVSVTAPVAATDSDPLDYDRTVFINERSDKFVCYFGVDMYTEKFGENDRFRMTATQIEKAEEILSDVLYTFGLMGALFLVCFIYLLVRAGRKKGSKDAYLLKTDRMFVDWRIALDCALGWLCFGGFIVLVDWFSYNDSEDNRKLLILGVTAVVTAFGAVVLDLILFITKHIKARTLLKMLFPVWLCVKCYGYFKRKIKPVLDEKLLYTKDFTKGTVIRIVFVALVNVGLVILACAETRIFSTFFLLLLWIWFDVAVLAWVFILIAGIHKIFSALEEIRKGNYNVYINVNSLPSTLRESAEKVMSLRDGLCTAVNEAVKQEQTKAELITNVSHDLKTPLTSIINYVELLKKCEINDEEAKEYLAVLGEKSDRLKKLIEDLVEASKASTGNIRVDFAQVSLNEMVSQLLGEHAEGLERRKLSIVTEIPEDNVIVNADGNLLYRVMENLIVNVEKYSLYGTRVYVSVRKENGFGTVTFKNISEQPLNITAEQLMERFVRGDASRSTEGNGLGLSIARSLCEIQNGSLEISINGDLFTAKISLKD